MAATTLCSFWIAPAIALLLFFSSAAVRASMTDPFEDVGDLCWASKSHRYYFAEDGKISRTNRRSGKTTRGLRMPLYGYGALGVISAKPLEEDVSILYQAANGGDLMGGMCRYRQEPWTKRWCRSFPSFNLIASVSSDKSIYVAGVGFVGRIDPATGQFFWRHNDLYSPMKPFVIIYYPFETDASVTFEGSASKPSPDLILTIDRRTGELLEYGGFDARRHTAKDRTMTDALRGRGACRK